MKNELFTIGPLTLYGYGLMIGIGILAGCWLVIYRGKKRNIDPDRLLSLILCTILCGFAGAKLLYWIVNIQEILRDPFFMFETIGDGFVVYGGILGGIAGAVLFCRHLQLNTLFYLDLMIPSLALGQGFGRIGCLLAGCCYGIEAQHFPSITFERSEFAPNHIPLVPVQVYASLLDFLLAAFLLFLAHRLKKEGQLTCVYLACYSAGRFFLEFLRGDAERGSFGPLSTSQLIAIFVFAIAIIVMLFRLRKLPS